MADLDPTRPVTAVISQLHADQDGPDRSRYVRLVLHPDVDDMRAAAARYDRRRGFVPAEHDESVGLFQPAPFRSRYDRRTKSWVDTASSFAGVVRLAQGYCTREIVAHEAAHAALHVTRLHDWAQPGGAGVLHLGDTVGPAEESFCYLLGSLIRELETLVDEAHHRMGRARA